MVDSSEWTAIEHVVERLTQRYPAVEPETVMTVVHRFHAVFDGSPLRDFVPLFVERRSVAELAKIGG